MQHLQLFAKEQLAKGTSRLLFCGAVFGLAFLPLAQAQQRQVGPADSTSLAYSSSSALPDDPGSVDGSQAPTLGGPTQTQPPTPTYGGQRRYGHQTYSDRWTNADGSKKVAFEFGAGLNFPVGGIKRYQTLDWSIRAGLGRNFNQRLGALIEYSYDRFGLPRQVILDAEQATGGAATDGTGHIWSFTLEPVFNYKTSGHFGGYLIGGGGFYRKMVVFTTPVQSYGYGYGYGYGYTQNVPVSHYSNNAGGINFGTGATWKASEYSSLKLFLEARYVWVDNSPVKYTTFGANKKSEYIPIVLGLRW